MSFLLHHAVSLFTECTNFPEAKITVAIADTSADSTAELPWLTQQSDSTDETDRTVTLSQGVTVTFGGEFDLDDVVASHITATGIKTWTYKNEFQIIEDSKGVKIVYYGNIHLETDLFMGDKNISIMSYAGNIITQDLNAKNITLIAEKGTVTTGAVATTNNFVVFHKKSTSFTPPAGSLVGGDLLINQTLRFSDNFPAANTINNLTVTSMAMSSSSGTCTLEWSGGGNITAASGPDILFDSDNGTLSNDGSTITLSYIGNITFQSNVDFKNTGYNLVVNAGGNITALAIDVSTGGNTGKNDKNDSQGRNLFLNARGAITTNDLYTAGGFSWSAQNTDAGDVTIKAGGAATVTYIKDIVASDNNGAGMGGGYSGTTNSSGKISGGNGGSLSVISGLDVNITFKAMTSTSNGGAGLGGGQGYVSADSGSVTGGHGGDIELISGGIASLNFTRDITASSAGGAGMAGGNSTCFATSANGSSQGGAGGSINIIAYAASRVLFQKIKSQYEGGAGLGGGGSYGSGQCLGGAGGSISILTGADTTLEFGDIQADDWGGSGLGGGYGRSIGGHSGDIVMIVGGKIKTAFQKIIASSQGGAGLGGGMGDGYAVPVAIGGNGGSIVMVAQTQVSLTFNGQMSAAYGGAGLGGGGTVYYYNSYSYSAKQTQNGNGGSIVITAGSSIINNFLYVGDAGRGGNGLGGGSNNDGPTDKTTLGLGGYIILVGNGSLGTQLDDANTGGPYLTTRAPNSSGFTFVLLSCSDNVITPLTQTFAGTTGANNTLEPVNNTSTQTLPNGFIAGYNTLYNSFILIQISATVYDTPCTSLVITAPDIQAVSGQSVTLQANSNCGVSSWEWYEKDGDSWNFVGKGETLTIQVTQTTTFKAVADNKYEKKVTVTVLPCDITITAPDIQAVSGQSVTLQAHANCDVSSWTWHKKTRKNWVELKGKGATLTIQVTQTTTFKAVADTGDEQQVTVTVYKPSNTDSGVLLLNKRC